MKALRQLGVVILLLMSYLTPAMACMVSGVQMTAEERACCRTMMDQCQPTGMPASHGCCQKSLQSSRGNALISQVVSDHPVAVPMIWLTAEELLHPTAVALGHVAYSDSPPPQPPPSSISVFRI